MKPWKPFALTIPPENGIGSGRRLESVKHVTHTAWALRILEDGRIQRGLIYDESALNAHRTTVAWLSPNRWHDGSRFGNVEFSFRFDALVGSRRLFWVENIDYKPPACRLLLTDQNVSNLPVTPYDPDTAKGPLQRVSGEWWWNGNITLELMLDADLDLRDCCELDFVKHHNNQCAIDWKTCAETGQAPQPAAARIIAGILGRGLTAVNHLLTNGTHSDVSPVMESGLCNIPMVLGACNEKLCGPVRNAAQADTLLRAALVQLSVGDKDAARKTAKVLASDNVLIKALVRLTEKHLGVSSKLLATLV